MSKSVFVLDTPKACLHCKMRFVIHEHNTGKCYQQCGLNHDGYKIESFFKEDDLKENWISPKCPLIDEEEFICNSEIYNYVTDINYIANHYDIDAILEAQGSLG